MEWNIYLRVPKRNPNQTKYQQNKQEAGHLFSPYPQAFSYSTSAK